MAWICLCLNMSVHLIVMIYECMYVCIYIRLCALGFKVRLFCDILHFCNCLIFFCLCWWSAVHMVRMHPCVHDHILKVCKHILQNVCKNFTKFMSVQLGTKMNWSHLEVKGQGYSETKYGQKRHFSYFERHGLRGRSLFSEGISVDILPSGVGCNDIAQKLMTFIYRNEDFWIFSPKMAWTEITYSNLTSW